MKWKSHKDRYLNQKLVKFIGVGLINTLVGYSIYAILIAANISYFLALFVATITGVTFNYFSIGRLVFKSSGGLVIYGKFITTYGLIYFVNAIGLELIIKNLGANPYLGQALCVPPSVLLSWLLMNYWVFKRRLTCRREN